ncbi:MerR family transcriptional regulator [Mucilaginibacter rubeus]|uniref:MerR family transcriptional regulator n=1 Tax=Mucilaginibacter rubeus TaxID=2027860 RepID=A0A5C1HXN8_9SPHI|nr:MerR family transcriptional regulator [Mucilaginibacter rubeus]QEM09950.1 MerR family transcriptional regulator [Mucilaginibacter rubeus]
MKYSISDLAQLSGISVHNIRIWERRYGALKPSRTEGNTRYYDDEQLKRLLCIAGLYHAGHKISRACALNKDDMSALLLEQMGSALLEEHRFEYFILQIVNQSLVYNEVGINELISDSFQVNGVQGTYKHVIYPILVRMGLMWLNESLCPSQEHFLSAIIRQKLLAAIDSLNPVVGEAGPGWLLFLPEDEDHDIGLLLASYLLRAAGRPVVYLGPKVPLFALVNTADVTKPQNLLFFMTRARPVADAQDYVDLLSAQFPAANILLSGNIKVLGSLDYPPGVTWLRSLADFESLIANPTEMPKP